MPHELLWAPSEERVKNSKAYRFMELINERHRFNGTAFHELWKWSTADHNPGRI